MIKLKRMKTVPMCTKKAEDRSQQNTHRGGSLNMADKWKWANQRRAQSSAARIPLGGRGQGDICQRTFIVALYCLHER